MFGKFFGSGKSNPKVETPKTDPVLEKAAELMPGPGPLWSIEGPRTDGSQFCLVPSFNGEFALLADVQFDVRYREDLITVHKNELLSCSDTLGSVGEDGDLTLRRGIPTVFRHLSGYVWTQTVKQGSFTVKIFLLEHDDENEMAPSTKIGSEATQITQSGEPLVMNVVNGLGTIAVNPSPGDERCEGLRHEGAEVLFNLFQSALWRPMLEDNFVLSYNPKYLVQMASKGVVGIGKASEVLTSGIIPVSRSFVRDSYGDVLHAMPVPVNIEFDHPTPFNPETGKVEASTQIVQGAAKEGAGTSFPVQKGRAIDPLGTHIGNSAYVSGDGELTYRISDSVSVDDGGVNVKAGGLTFGSKGVTTEVAGMEVNLSPKSPFEKLSEPKRTGGIFGTKKEDTEMGLFGPRKKKKGFFD